MSDDHLTLLGSQSSFFTNPDDARLESFPNRGTRPYTITLNFPPSAPLPVNRIPVT